MMGLSSGNRLCIFWTQTVRGITGRYQDNQATKLSELCARGSRLGAGGPGKSLLSTRERGKRVVPSLCLGIGTSLTDANVLVARTHILDVPDFPRASNFHLL